MSPNLQTVHLEFHILQWVGNSICQLITSASLWLMFIFI